MSGDEKNEVFSKKIKKSFEGFLQSRERVRSSAMRILKDGDEDARWMAAEVLGEIGGEVVIEPLISTIKTESSPNVRCAILRALYAYTDEEKVLEVFKYAMEYDTDPLVRALAKEEVRELIELD